MKQEMETRKNSSFFANYNFFYKYIDTIFKKIKAKFDSQHHIRILSLIAKILFLYFFRDPELTEIFLDQDPCL